MKLLDNDWGLIEVTRTSLHLKGAPALAFLVGLFLLGEYLL